MIAKRMALALAVGVVLWLSALIAARVVGSEKAREFSPDARWVATARTHWSPDPPFESLWLGRFSEQLEKIQVLGEDSQWCSAIVWSEDSRRVAFVINGAEALVVEAGSRDQRQRVQLVPDDSYPTTREVRTLRFSEDGQSLVFRDCLRSGSECRDKQVRIPA